MTSWKLKVTAAAFLAVLVVIWIVQNGGDVETKFLFTTVTMPQSALLSITLLTGLVAGILLAVGLSGKWKKKDKQPAAAVTPTSSSSAKEATR